MSEGVNEGELNGFTPEEATQPRVVVLISGGGTNLQALIDAQSHDELGGEIVAVWHSGCACRIYMRFCALSAVRCTYQRIKWTRPTDGRIVLAVLSYAALPPIFLV